MNEKSFESRRVRTQPCTRAASIGEVLSKACLIEMDVAMAGSLPDDRDPTSGSKRVSASVQLAHFSMLPKCGGKRRQNAG